MVQYEKPLNAINYIDMANKIYVGRISSSTTEKQLFDHFSQVGTVVNATIEKGINPRVHSGHGYVIMSTEGDTQKAIAKLNNSQLGDSRLHVVLAHFLDQEKKRYYTRKY